MIHQSKQATKRKLNRLVELGVLAYKKIIGQEQSGKDYIVNPYFLKRGKDHSEYLSTVFYDFARSS